MLAVHDEGALILLPLLFKEDPTKLLKKVNNTNSSMEIDQLLTEFLFILLQAPAVLPCIVTNDYKALANASYFVCAENLNICQTNNFTDALEAIISTIFLFNLEYPKELKKTLSFIGNNVCQLEPPIKQLQPQIALVLNKLL